MEMKSINGTVGAVGIGNTIANAMANSGDAFKEVIQSVAKRGARVGILTPVMKVMRNELAKQFPMIAVAKDGDVGYDLASTISGRGWIIIMPFTRKLIPTGIHIELSQGYWASIEARSSTSKRSLIVPKGVIDEGYRGELFAQILNVGLLPRIIRNGDRVVQLIPHKRVSAELVVEEVDQLSESERGSSGFGSTGISVI